MAVRKSVGMHVAMMLCPVMAIAAITYVTASSTWSQAASMSTRRGFHTATLLPDGRVLVTGGTSGGYPDQIAPVASTELYDPGLGTWSPATSMSTSRSGHSATLLSDGRVLITGGTSQFRYERSAEIYNPAARTWSPAGSMSTSRYYHSATLLPDGRVLVSGGSVDGHSFLATAEIYDPVLGTWSPTGSMSTVRFAHTATLMSDGRVLLSGGQYDGITSGGTAEIYDPRFGTWSGVESMRTPRAAHTATLLPDGRVLVSGGYNAYDFQIEYLGSAELYDPVRGTWSPTGSMSAPRSDHTNTLLLDGRVFVSGGSDGYDYLATAETYDATRGAWLGTGSMSTGRIWLSSTLLQDGRVLVSGGFNRDGYLATAEFFWPSATPTDDTTPPQVSCAAADGAWHNSNVAIACTASDLGSGLANAAEASFALTTNVPVGSETTNAVTNSRQVCDIAGNCSTAGSVIGNRVDRKAPTITIASPAQGAVYVLHATVAASYTCSDGGAGMTSCAGPVVNGSPVNTASKGTKTFAVTAIDTVGNRSIITVTYSIVPRGKK